MNRVFLEGYLGRDPEIRRTQDGRPIAQLSVATSERWKDKATGEPREKTEWHRVTVFNEGLAKTCEQYVKKGAHVLIEGSLATRKWTDQAGIDRYSTEVVLGQFNSTLRLLDRAERAPTPTPESYGRESAPPPREPAGPRADLDDEIPF